MIQSNKLSFEEMNEIVSDMKNRGNSDLTKVMDFLSDDFEETKNLIIELHKSKFLISYFECLIILFIKFLYYELKIIPLQIFRKLKNYFIGLTEEDNKNFIILNID